MCTFVCENIHVYTCVNAHKHTHSHTHTHTPTHPHTHIHAPTHTHMHIYGCVRIVEQRQSTTGSVSVKRDGERRKERERERHTHAHTHTRTHTHTYTRTHAHIHTHIYTGVSELWSGATARPAACFRRAAAASKARTMGGRRLFRGPPHRTMLAQPHTHCAPHSIDSRRPREAA